MSKQSPEYFALVNKAEAINDELFALCNAADCASDDCRDAMVTEVIGRLTTLDLLPCWRRYVDKAIDRLRTSFDRGNLPCWRIYEATGYLVTVRDLVMADAIDHDKAGAWGTKRLIATSRPYDD